MAEYNDINAFFRSLKRKDPAGPDGHQKAGEAATVTTGVSPDGFVKDLEPGRKVALLQPPFESSHGSSLLALPSGGLLLAWFSGQDEGGDGVAIVVSRLAPQACRWSMPRVASRQAGRSAQNPILFVAGPRLVLMHTSQVPAHRHAPPATREQPPTRFAGSCGRRFNQRQPHR